MRNIVMDMSSHAGSGVCTSNEQCLPVPNATTPYWRTQLHWIDAYRSTDEIPSECDVAIIGAGLSGVAAAYHLSKLNGDDCRSIVMLEAREVCSGATGRNGGHVKIKNATMQSYIKRHGIEMTERLSKFVNSQIYALKHTVEAEKLDCEFELRRSYDVYLDDTEARDLGDGFSKSVANGEEWTREMQLIDTTTVEQVTSMKGAKSAISMQACSMWPYKFVSQLLARLLQREQVNLQTNTPVTKVAYDKALETNLVHTPRGLLKAKKVIFATNAYTGGICPLFTKTIVPTRITASHIAPCPKPISPHLSHTYNIHYFPGNRVDYLNPRPDGGIVVGGAKWTYAHHRNEWYNNWDDSRQLPNAKGHFDGLMQRHYKGWEESGAKVDSIWTGITGTTTDEMPHVGHVPGEEGRQFIMAGYNGGGMSMIFLIGKAVAEMVNGKTYEETGLPPVFEATLERAEAGRKEVRVD